MVTFIILAAVALCALLIGLVAVVGGKTLAVAAATETTVEAASAASGGWATIRTQTTTTPTWAAVRAQILWTLQSESKAKRAAAARSAQRKVAKRHRRWERRAAAAEGRAQALAAAAAARQAARTAAKAAQRAKSAAVAERYGHAAQRAAAVVRAHRRLVAAGLATPVTLTAGIKAGKRAERGSTVAANARKRATNLAARQEANARKRVAASEGQLAFEAQREGRQAAQRATARAAAEGRARRAALAEMTPDQVRLGQAVVRLERKALAKLRLMAWLEAGNGKVTKGGLDRTLHLTGQAVAAREGFEATFGVTLEAGASWVAWKAAKTAQRAARRSQVAA